MRIIGGLFRNQTLVVPRGAEVRPSTGQLRGAVFNICQNIIEGSAFLDVFAGSGAMGLEALSRGAAHATFAESDRQAAAAIRQNLSTLGVEAQGTLIVGDALRVLQRLAKEGKSFDIIFADPPYAKHTRGAPLGLQLLQLVDQFAILRPGGLLFLEEASEAAPSAMNLQNLTIVNQRQYGRSTLQQWTTR